MSFPTPEFQQLLTKYRIKTTDSKQYSLNLCHSDNWRIRPTEQGISVAELREFLKSIDHLPPFVRFSISTFMNYTTLNFLEVTQRTEEDIQKDLNEAIETEQAILRKLEQEKRAAEYAEFLRLKAIFDKESNSQLNLSTRNDTKY